MDNMSFNAGTCSAALSQYISLPAKLLFSSGILASPYGYGMDSQLWMDMLDVPISMYDVVQNCRGFWPKPGNGRSVTLPFLPWNIQYTSLPASIMDCPRASWNVDAIRQQKYVCSVRYATKTIAERSFSPQSASFWSTVEHTSPGDTNSGTAWWLLAKQQLSWHSANGLGFAPVYRKLRYRDLWMRHHEPPEVVTLTGWMGKHGAVAVVAARWLHCDQIVNDKASWIFPSTASIVSLILLANMDAADSEPYNSVRVCNLEIMPTDWWQLREHLGVPKTYELQLEAGGISTTYGPCDNYFTKWMFQLFEPTRNGITPDRYETRQSCGRLLHPATSYRCDKENWTCKRRYAHLGDARRWMIINLSTMAIYKKLCGILPYLIYLLWMTIYETSNWMPRCSYTYQRPCCTEYNPDNYGRGYINQPYGGEYNADYNADYNAYYNVDYNTKYNAKFVTKLYYWEYYPECDPNSDSEISMYASTIAIDDSKSTLESTPNLTLPIDVAYKAEYDSLPAEQQSLNDGDDRTGIATATTNTSCTGSAERSTVRYIHQLRRLAAASAPGDESSSGLKERWFVHGVKWWQAHPVVRPRGYPTIWENKLTEHTTDVQYTSKYTRGNW